MSGPTHVVVPGCLCMFVYVSLVCLLLRGLFIQYVRLSIVCMCANLLTHVRKCVSAFLQHECMYVEPLIKYT